MILVDKNIKKLISENKLIISGYKEENLKGIAYELTIDSIYNSEKNAVYPTLGIVLHKPQRPGWAVFPAQPGR